MKKIDAIGDKCPIPVIKAKNELKNMNSGEKLTISVDNEIACQNLSKLAEENKYEKSVHKINSSYYEVTITKANAEVNNQAQNADNIVVAFSSDKMGEGSDELGSALMKSFIYALSEAETVPQTLLFYNSGAFLTAEGSKSIDDLVKLQEKGTEILTCGACMDYYNLKEKLQIGGVTNMYSIVEKLMAACKVIKP